MIAPYAKRIPLFIHKAKPQDEEVHPVCMIRMDALGDAKQTLDVFQVVGNGLVNGVITGDDAYAERDKLIEAHAKE